MTAPGLLVESAEPGLVWAGFAVAMLVALLCALSAVRHLGWPAESDHFRDLGTANSFLDGEFWRDHTLVGEVQWYPPLLPALIALFCRVTGTATHVAYAQGGPWLNLLGPLFFFLVARRWLGPLAALAATFGMLFFGSHSLAAWKHATYSAWLWPCEFAQGAFFATLASHPGLASDGDGKARRWRSAGTGALLGLTFLSHPAPALILTLAFGAYAIGCWLTGQENNRGRWIELAIIAGVSFLVVVPFLAPVYHAYHFKTLNPDPARHVGLALSEILREVMTPRMLLAVVGIGTAWWAHQPGKPSRGTVLMFAVAGSSVVLFLYGLAAQLLERHHVLLPELTPGFHFHIYVDAFVLMAFGVGFVALARQMVAPIRALGLSFVSDSVAVTSALFILTLPIIPTHLASTDLATYRQDAVTFSNDPGIYNLYDWLRQHTSPGTVVLCDDALTVYTVAPAGRAVVSMPENYSNPYVARDQRAADRDRLFEALRAGDRGQFANLAARYGVQYVAFRDGLPADLARFNLKTVGRFGNIDLTQIVPG